MLSYNDVSLGYAVSALIIFLLPSNILWTLPLSWLIFIILLTIVLYLYSYICLKIENWESTDDNWF